MRKFKFDYALPRIKVAIEIEGGIYSGRAHGSVTGILRDMEKYNLAAMLGWRVIRIEPKRVDEVMPAVREWIDRNCSLSQWSEFDLFATKVQRERWMRKMEKAMED